MKTKTLQNAKSVITVDSDKTKRDILTEGGILMNTKTETNYPELDGMDYAFYLSPERKLNCCYLDRTKLDGQGNPWYEGAYGNCKIFARAGHSVYLFSKESYKKLTTNLKSYAEITLLMVQIYADRIVNVEHIVDLKYKKHFDYYWFDKETFVLDFDELTDDDGDVFNYFCEFHKNENQFVFYRVYENDDAVEAGFTKCQREEIIRVMEKLMYSDEQIQMRENLY
jgi:hypothetical protein